MKPAAALTRDEVGELDVRIGRAFARAAQAAIEQAGRNQASNREKLAELEDRLAAAGSEQGTGAFADVCAPICRVQG